jgi:predicted esterase
MPRVPFLVLAAGDDAIIPLPRIRAAVDAGRSAGDSVELRVRPSEGHTLMVGPSLASAVDWLLRHGPR